MTFFVEPETGKYQDGIVAYAVLTLKEEKEARSFYKGFIKDIKKYPDKYSKTPIKNPTQHARAEILLTLLFHFRNQKTRIFWENIVKNREED